jgi:hypothetical protein
MSIEDEVADVIRAVNAIALREVHNYLDYKTVLLKLVEVVADGVQRGGIIGCIKWLRNSYERFCCILSTLRLLDLEKKYCVYDLL